MFKIDRTANRLEKLEEKRFSELNFREREHLQEWLAAMPSALGEDLLIIQKEFDGFDGTRERLDLLALDKDGQLVVIENKLDDTGRDVAWQAMKYAAYFSTLTKAQVVDVYQRYLDAQGESGSAVTRICEFLSEEQLDDVVLNAGNSQRLIFIAAAFRKEVTSTVLWLIGHGINVQCFRAAPYAFGEELLLDIQQIIPPPEAEEFMIGMASKELEEKSTQGALKSRHRLRLEFWERALDAMKDRGVDLYQNVNPGKDHWLNAGSGVSGCPYGLIFGKDEVRVELIFARASQDENKWLFDMLIQKKRDIEAAFGAPLVWKRLDEKKSSRVEFRKSFDGYDRANWPAMIEWLVIHIQKLEGVCASHLQRLNKDLRRGEMTSVNRGNNA